MKLLHAFDRALTATVTALLVLILAAMLGLAATQVFLRDFFHTGILWGDVAARHLVIWVGFFGAYLATHENRHFHIDVLTRFLSVRLRLWFAAFSDLFAAAICYLLMDASITFLSVGIDADAVTFLNLSQRTLALIVPVGFGLIMVQFLLRTVASVAGAVRGVPREEVV